MSIPVITPFFFKEFVDVKSRVGGRGNTSIVISPYSIDYVVLLNDPAVVKRLMGITDPIAFNRVIIDDPEREPEFRKNAEELVARFPVMEHFWSIRTLIMGVLQNAEWSLDRRLLILNYTLKTIQGMVDQYQQDLIPGFCEKTISMPDFMGILKFFEGITVNPAYSLTDGINFLKRLEKTSEWKHMMGRVYSGLGISGPETMNLMDFPKYIDKRAKFAENYLEQRGNIFTNILVNYVWTMAMPFAVPEMGIWENFVFFNALFNALKILITTTQPKDDDDFAEIIACFDRTFYLSNKDNRYATRYMQSAKMSSLSGNGDMAMLTIS
ncbi:MAG: hypothetical protein LBM87_08210 [Ruminococcus sp.]|jgi:hypothetical protein|nr:hypothetical protein [Ruminococcus sp.]